MFDHFVGLALKGLTPNKVKDIFPVILSFYPQQSHSNMVKACALYSSILYQNKGLNELKETLFILPKEALFNLEITKLLCFSVPLFSPPSAIAEFIGQVE